mmetsp:Transcript_61442/g.187660  ORF Transcript_61442/g.187660 Transcript_61442/m.187660 type:complete len:471 (+) Transcript_61442:750-2162(+)
MLLLLGGRRAAGLHCLWHDHDAHCNDHLGVVGHPLGGLFAATHANAVPEASRGHLLWDVPRAMARFVRLSRVHRLVGAAVRVRTATEVFELSPEVARADAADARPQGRIRSSCGAGCAGRVADRAHQQEGPGQARRGAGETPRDPHGLYLLADRRGLAPRRDDRIHPAGARARPARGRDDVLVDADRGAQDARGGGGRLRQLLRPGGCAANRVAAASLRRHARRAGLRPSSSGWPPGAERRAASGGRAAAGVPTGRGVRRAVPRAGRGHRAGRPGRHVRGAGGGRADDRQRHPPARSALLGGADRGSWVRAAWAVHRRLAGPAGRAAARRQPGGARSERRRTRRRGAWPNLARGGCAAPGCAAGRPQNRALRHRSQRQGGAQGWPRCVALAAGLRAGPRSPHQRLSPSAMLWARMVVRDGVVGLQVPAAHVGHPCARRDLLALRAALPSGGGCGAETRRSARAWCSAHVR